MSLPTSIHDLTKDDEPARSLTGDTVINTETLNSPVEDWASASPPDHDAKSEKGQLSSPTLCVIPAHRKALSCLVHVLRNGRNWLSSHGQLDEEKALPKLELPSPIVRSLNCPKTGYPNLATFTDSDEAFMLFRRFGYLQTRVLLDRQEELRLLEEELERFDGENLDQLTSRPVSPQHLGLRRALLDRIEAVLERYTSLLTCAQQLMSFYRPADNEYRAVCTYLDNNKPIHRFERTYIRHRDDLVTLRPGREHAWLDRSIEFALRKLHRPFPFLKHAFSDKMTRLKAEGRKYEIYFSRERINMLANLIIMIMILALLVIPTYLLYHLVTSHGNNIDNHVMAVGLGILLVFTLAFSAVLSLFTRARRHEILGAAAAYCAVLVVFFGNINTSS